MIDWMRSLGPDAVVWIIALAAYGALCVLGLIAAVITNVRLWHYRRKIWRRPKARIVRR